MWSRELWSRVRSRAGSVLRAANEWTGGPCKPENTFGLPEAALLEDRILFNAAPVDAAALEVQVETSPIDGAASLPLSEPLSSSPADSGSSSTGPEASASTIAEDDPGLFAPDQYISVNPEDRIVAFFSLGGTDNPHNRNIGYGIDKTGWEIFISDWLQPVIDDGVSRIELHTPFGARSYVVDPVTGEASNAPGQWAFQFDAYLDAQVEVPKATEDFVSAWQAFFAENETTGKVQEVIPYLGSPRLDPDQTALIDTPDLWWDRAYDILIPMFDAGFRSIGFDASAPATPDTLDFELHDVLRYPELRDPQRDARLIEAVGDERIEVYLEAVPYRATGRTDFPILLLDWAWVDQDPERPGAHFTTRQERFPEHDSFTGEVIRIVRHEQWKGGGAAPVENILLQGNTAAVTPSFFLRPANGGADSLEGFIQQMDLPALPTLVDLDPDDVNPATATYTIISGPDHGTLTLNRFHDDVFTYTPNDYYSGVDSFEYVVTDPSGASSSAIVRLFVNTEVVVPAAVIPVKPPPPLPGEIPIDHHVDPPVEPPVVLPIGPPEVEVQLPLEPTSPPEITDPPPPLVPVTDAENPSQGQPSAVLPGEVPAPPPSNQASAPISPDPSSSVEPSVLVPAPPTVSAENSGDSSLPEETVDDFKDLDRAFQPAANEVSPPSDSVGTPVVPLPIGEGVAGPPPLATVGPIAPPVTDEPSDEQEGDLQSEPIDLVVPLEVDLRQPQSLIAAIPPETIRVDWFTAWSRYRGPLDIETDPHVKELEALGLFAEADTAEIVDHPMGPMLRVRYHFGFLQVSLNMIKQWMQVP